MALDARVEVSVKDFQWFREILVRARDLEMRLAGEELGGQAALALRSFSAALHVKDAKLDQGQSDLFGP